MIKNDRQLKASKKWLRSFERDLAEIEKKYGAEKNKRKLLSHGYVEQIAQLKEEIDEYHVIKSTPLPLVLRAQNASEISKRIVHLRLARGFTQADLGKKIGCKQSDISRLEDENYEGFTYSLLNRIAKAFDVKLEISFIISEIKKSHGANLSEPETVSTLRP
jgi:ribosome-binding protein aMBF1 (putative translation factor)